MTSILQSQESAADAPRKRFAGVRPLLRAANTNYLFHQSLAAVDSDRLEFLPESAEAAALQNDPAHNQWKVLIIDDEPQVHSVTKLVLQNFSFQGRTLAFYSGFSAEEGRRLLREHSDAAIVLLDVVMETEHAGLQLARHIREELKNTFIRIILRTGHPGQAPEGRVVVNYDINDYKEKSELTAQKLTTTITSALRSYRDLKTIDSNQRGLEQITRSAPIIFKSTATEHFARNALHQMISIVNLDKSPPHCVRSGLAATSDSGRFRVVAGAGSLENFIGRDLNEALSEDVLAGIAAARDGGAPSFAGDVCWCYFASPTNDDNLIVLENAGNLTEWDRHLIEVFCTNVAVAYDNIYLNQEIEDTQKEVVFTLGEVIENRSRETGNHVNRVAEYTFLFAKYLAMDPAEAEMLRTASPMHDVGKIAIPDSVLNKPGPLTDEEFDLMKTHTTRGHDMMKGSSREMLQTASILALQHHEKYDGSGYPQGLEGDAIHIYGRITAIADVFDALGSDRAYRPAWDFQRILSWIQNERAKHFDPQLVDIFFDNLDTFVSVRDSFQD